MVPNRFLLRFLIATICGTFLALCMASESHAGTTPASPTQDIRPSTPRCILLSMSLCGAVHDRSTLALASAQTAAVLADGITTRQSVRRGNVEIDPLTRVFIGRRPTWSRMLPLGMVQVVAETWISQRMKDSKHNWLRRCWWLPLVVGIAANSAGTIDNLTRR